MCDRCWVGENGRKRRAELEFEQQSVKVEEVGKGLDDRS